MGPYFNDPTYHQIENLVGQRKNEKEPKVGLV